MLQQEVDKAQSTLTQLSEADAKIDVLAKELAKVDSAASSANAAMRTAQRRQRTDAMLVKASWAFFGAVFAHIVLFRVFGLSLVG